MTTEAIARRYRLFAAREAWGNSAVFDGWARGVAGDSRILARLDLLPYDKQQPNLVFAASRLAGCPIADFATWRDWLLANWEVVRAVIETHSTQTNEAARCGAFLPLLGEIDGPIALLEVGASAGLCLYPDRYSYRYAAGRRAIDLDPADGPSGVVIPVEVAGDAPLPAELPEVVWRGGIDLHPIDVRDAEELAWLETLVWPEHDARRERLRAAAAVAASDPPHLRRGDLVELLESTAEQAHRDAPDATLVIFHSVVLSYLTPAACAAFVERVGSVDAVWLSAEATGVLPDVTARLPHGTESVGRLILARDGQPVALAGPHGGTLEWL
jgi:hypothetical protein